MLFRSGHSAQVFQRQRGVGQGHRIGQAGARECPLRGQRPGAGVRQARVKPRAQRLAEGGRLALQHLRRECHVFQSLDSLGDTLAERVAAAADVDADRATVLFQQAIAKLPTQQRLAFNMRYYDEMPYEEMAVVTGKTVGSLKTNYHLAVEKIKRYVKDNSI